VKIGSPETSVHVCHTKQSRIWEGTNVCVKYLCSKVMTYEVDYVRMLHGVLRFYGVLHILLGKLGHVVLAASWKQATWKTA
jgi:hypothetical protein